MKIYKSSFALLTSIMDLGAAYLSLEERPQTFTECSFFTQCCTASALCCVVDTDPDIDFSKDQIYRRIGKSIVKITPQYKGAEREISSRAAHRIHPERYALSFAIHKDLLFS